MKINSRDISIIYIYFLSNVIMYIIPLIVATILVVNISNSMKEQINNNYIYNLEIATNDFERQMDNLVSSAMEILVSSNQNLNDIQKQTNVIQLVDNLRSYKSKNIYSAEVLLYSDENSTLYTCDGTFNVDDFFTKYIGLNDSKVVLEEVKSRTNATVNVYRGKTNDFIYFVRSISTKMSPYRNITVTIQIPWDKFLERFSSITGTRNGLVFINKDGEKVIDFTQDSDLRGKILISHPNEAARYEIGYYIDENIIYGNIEMIYISFALTALITLIMGLLFSWYLAKKRYEPIKRLEGMLDKIMTVEKHKNEIENINSIIFKMISNQKIEEDEMERQKKFLYYNIATILLNNSGLIENEDLINFGVDFNKEYYFVAVLYCYEDDGKEISKKLDAIDGILHAEIHSEKCIAVIFNSENCDIEEKKNTINVFSEKISCKNHIGVGNTYNSLNKVYTSLLEALSTKTSDFSRYQVIYYSEMYDTNNGAICRIDDKVARFIQCVKFGDTQTALMMLDDVIQTFKLQVSSKLYEKMLIYEVANSLFNLMKELNLTQCIMDISFVIEKNNLEDAQEELNKIVIVVCKNIKQKNDEENIKASLDIIEFINNNCHDYNMSIEYVADKLNKNEKYVSSVVKNETGKFFREYLCDIRMEKAKKFIEENNVSVNKLCELTGYLNVSHFIKNFKSYTGFTPAQYIKTFEKSRFNDKT